MKKLRSFISNKKVMSDASLSPRPPPSHPTSCYCPREGLTGYSPTHLDPTTSSSGEASHERERERERERGERPGREGKAARKEEMMLERRQKDRQTQIKRQRQRKGRTEKGE